MSTLQRRISTALTSVIVLFVAAHGFLAYSSLEDQEDDLVDDIVLAETRRLVARMADGDRVLQDAEPPVRLAPDMVAWLLAPGRHEETLALPPYLRGLADGPHRIHSDVLVVHSVIQTTDAGRLYVSLDATRNEEFVYRFGRYLTATGLLIIAIGWLLSVWLARIVVSPIRRLAERLAQWSPGSTTRSVSESDEEALLLQAFDQAQRKLDEAIAHEREFAANVRHEVRTPLSALRTDAEMLLLTATLEPPARDRLHRMIETVDAVADSVESTWSLSTAEPARPEALDLAACVDSAWASLQHLNADDRMRLHNLLADSDDRPELDRQALMTILRNLLRNAIEHAAPGTCEVRRTPSGIEIADDGLGIGADDLPHVFDRYFRGRLADSATVAGPAEVAPAETAPPAATVAAGRAPSKTPSRPPDPHNGRGLGLAMARQAALRQGWQLTARSSAGTGTVFRLDFQN